MDDYHVVTGKRKLWHNGKVIPMRAVTKEPYATINFWNSLFNKVQVRYEDHRVVEYDVSVYDIHIEPYQRPPAVKTEEETND